jgi:hypothetical protein
VVELVAIVMSLFAVRRSSSSSTKVVASRAMLVLPAVTAPPRPHRLARGSVEQPATPMPEDLPRRRPLRPTHARR